MDGHEISIEASITFREGVDCCLNLNDGLLIMYNMYV
jgi:hypothetical protein